MSLRIRSLRIRTTWVLLTTAAVAGVAAAAGTPAHVLFGFTQEQSVTQQAIEQRFDAALDTDDLRDWLRALSAEANQVGSPHDKANAEFVRDRLKEWGWDAQIETFFVLYPTLRKHSLELIAPAKFSASLVEPPVPGDATSARTDAMGAYNVYGADGDVTGDLVYVNNGMLDDYKDLTRRGVDVRGKIVISRYGGGWRGLKPKLAQEHGAIGCIIYSDPHDDGYAAGDVYPQGGWRPAQGLQRGSVLDMPVYPGDPLTPGTGSTKGARRLPIAQAKTIAKIPVLPISFADAQPLLAALGGPVAPPAWRGSLPLTYHLGPGPARVHLTVSSDWGQKPLYDVIARIPGSQSPDEWVIRGNHRDAWVYGAWDPLAGQAAMMAEAKAIGALVKSGWRPKRTLLYASWDGEEPGLLGSTEWVEQHEKELQRKAVLYVNSDLVSRGFLHAGGSHSLQRLVNDVAAGVKDPETNVSVEERLRAAMRVDGADREASEEDHKNAGVAEAGGDLPLAALGSGSDYTAFLQHTGIASLNIEYRGEGEQIGSYHSAYDTFEHYVRFGDPEFVYGVAEAQTAGHIMLRVADADVLPMQFDAFASTVGDYVQSLHRLADNKRKAAEDLGRLLDAKVFALATDPTRPVKAPEREPEVPYIDFARLDNVVARLRKSAKRYDDAYAQAIAKASQLSLAQRAQLDALLQGMEGALTDSRGLPGRSWYRHLVYAPGLYTGYGVKTIPGVREAIDQNRWEEANQYSLITAFILSGYCDRLDKATALLE